MADESRSPEPALRSEAPVELSGRLLKTAASNHRVEISLAIGEEFEIYAERRHEFLLPLTVEFLDANQKPIKARLVFPNPKVVPFDEDLGGDRYVYQGNVRLIGTCAAQDGPVCVRVSYHGYSKRGY